jgi:hypothetical protein
MLLIKLPVYRRKDLIKDVLYKLYYVRAGKGSSAIVQPLSIHQQLFYFPLSCTLVGKGSSAMVQPLSIRQLPINPKQRFERLFAFKPQWEASELEPYLQGMQVGRTSCVFALLFYLIQAVLYIIDYLQGMQVGRTSCVFALLFSGYRQQATL